MSLATDLTKLQQTRPGSTCKKLDEVARDVQNLHEIVEDVVTVAAAGGAAPYVIGGLTTGVVAAATATFTIDTIVSFTPGYTHATSPQTVVNTFLNGLSNNQPVFAIYRPDNDTWETWYDTDSGAGGGGVYTAGFGLTLTVATFSVDATNYVGAGDELFGSEAGSVTWYTTAEWLQGLTGYAGAGNELIGAAAGTVTWDTVTGWLETLTDYSGAAANTQTLGHLSTGAMTHYPMASLALGLAAADVACTAATFDGDTFTVLSGVAPSATQTIDNPFGFSVDNNEDILIGRLPDAATWKLLFAALPSIAYGEATAAVASGDATFTADTFSPLCGKSPGASETIDNTFGFAIDIDGLVLVVRFPGDATWHCWQAECPA